MTVTAPTVAGRIVEPGVYDIPADLYHRDPVPEGSLSVSGARKLLPPSCPAKFRYERTHPPAPTQAMEFGTAAHRLVLGHGADIAEVDADSWRTKAAQEAADEARAEGKTPLLRHEHQQVQAMAAALRQHPIAAALLQPDGGAAERSLFWQDRETGTWRRARPDWLPDPRPGRRLVVPDYKSCKSASPDKLGHALHDYGYAQQAAWYVDGVNELGLADGDAEFVFIFQEKTAPYLVTVAAADEFALNIGRQLNRRAIETYRQCTESGIWPGYADDVAYISLPPWVQRQFDI